MSEAEGRLDPVETDRGGFTRRNFIKTAAWTGAALTAAGIGGVGFATRFADAQTKPYQTYIQANLADVDILQFALGLEQLEADFYTKAVSTGILQGADLTQLTAIRDHEQAHVQALTKAIQQAGATPRQAESFTFPSGTFQSRDKIVQLAATFEPVGVGAYTGAAPAIKEKKYLASAGAILGVECEHRVAINILMGVVPPNNKAFEDPLALSTVASKVKPFNLNLG